jgi:hypothetical protein
MSAKKIDHPAVGELAHGNHTSSKCCPAMADETAQIKTRGAIRAPGERAR